MNVEKVERGRRAKKVRRKEIFKKRKQSKDFMDFIVYSS